MASEEWCKGSYSLYLLVSHIASSFLAKVCQIVHTAQLTAEGSTALTVTVRRFLAVVLAGVNVIRAPWFPTARQDKEYSVLLPSPVN